MKLFGFKVKTPLYWRIYIIAALILVTAVLAVNVYISKLLVDYESSQPKYEAQRVVAAKFPGETGFTYIKTTNVYETVKGAAVYVVKKDGVPYAKVVLAPEGENAWKEYSVTMIEASTPTPPPPSPSPSVTPEPPSPTPELPKYDAELQEEHGDYVLKAIQTYAQWARATTSRNNMLTYYLKGSDLYEELRTCPPLEWVTVEGKAAFEDKIADEFIKISDSEFSCRVRMTFVVRREGRADYIDKIDFQLVLTKGDDGKYYISKQYPYGYNPGGGDAPR